MAEPIVYDLQIRQLLQRFPNGFSVSPKGLIYEVVASQRNAQELPILNGPGGYLAVTLPELKPGDDFYGQQGEQVFMRLTPSEMADALDRLIKLADTMAEDEILRKLYLTYSQRLEAAAAELGIQP